jgi:hypothetical protein
MSVDDPAIPVQQIMLRRLRPVKPGDLALRAFAVANLRPGDAFDRNNPAQRLQILVNGYADDLKAPRLIPLPDLNE